MSYNFKIKRIITSRINRILSDNKRIKSVWRAERSDKRERTVMEKSWTNGLEKRLVLIEDWKSLSDGKECDKPSSVSHADQIPKGEKGSFTETRERPLKFNLIPLHCHSACIVPDCVTCSINALQSRRYQRLCKTRHKWRKYSIRPQSLNESMRVELYKIDRE